MYRREEIKTKRCLRSSLSAVFWVFAHRNLHLSFSLSLSPSESPSESALFMYIHVRSMILNSALLRTRSGKLAISLRERADRSVRQRRITALSAARHVSAFQNFTAEVVGDARAHIKGAAIGAKLFYARVAFARVCTYAHRGVYTARVLPWSRAVIGEARWPASIRNRSFKVRAEYAEKPPA